MSLEERIARVEEAVKRIEETLQSQLNHFHFYQKLILLLLAALLFLVGAKDVISFIFK